jgi:hypothetical protein
MRRLGVAEKRRLLTYCWFGLALALGITAWQMGWDSGFHRGLSYDFDAGRRYDRAEAIYHGYVATFPVPQPDGSLRILAPWKNRWWEVLSKYDILGQGPEYWARMRNSYLASGEGGHPWPTGKIPTRMARHPSGVKCPEHEMRLQDIELGE